MPKRPCLDCGKLFNPPGSRCPGCASIRGRQRDRARGSRQARGLGADHDRIVRQLLKDNPPCHWCGAPATTGDHLVPRSQGGLNVISNYVPACKPCNDSHVVTIMHA